MSDLSMQDFLGGGAARVSDQKEKKEAGFLDNVSDRLEERQAQAREIFAAHDAEAQTIGETGLQLVGKAGVGGFLDIVGEGAMSVVDAAVNVMNAHPATKKLTEPFVEAGRAILESDAGKNGVEAAKQGVETYTAWAKENPRAARNLESVVNIGTLITPVKVKAKSAKPIQPEQTTLSKLSVDARNASRAQQLQIKSDYVDDLVMPKETAARRVANVDRTSVSETLQTKKVVMSADEKDMAQIVKTIDGVSPKNTAQKNFNAIRDEIGGVAETLKKELDGVKVPIPKKQTKARLAQAREVLEETPVMVGDAAKSANQLLRKFEKLVDQHPGTATGLLDARKEFDAWVKQFKPKAFDPATDNAMTVALREIRQTANDLLAERAPTARVKELLREQHLMYRALDNIRPKAADEMNTMLARGWQNVSRVLPLRSEFNQTMATIFGVGGLGAAAQFAPMFTQAMTLGVATYAGGRLVLSPGTKRGISMLLHQMDLAIKKTTNPEMLRQLRADRAAIMEMSKEGVEATKAAEPNKEQP